jgi:hypothetical protein
MQDYYSVESWHNFIKTKIAPIRDYGQAIVNFWKFLKGFDGEHIGKVLRDYPRLNVVFLGGVDENGYREDSFANAIRELFGAEITDLKAYFSFVTQDLEPAVPIRVEKIKILECIELIKDVANLIIDKADVDAEENYKLQEEYINNPEKIFEGLLEFLQHCIYVCVGSDEYMTFAWNIRKITKKYLNLVFPETKKDENFKFLSEFLGLTELFVPDIDDVSLRDEYTIYGFPDIYTKFDVSDRYVDWVNPDKIPYTLKENLSSVITESVNTLGGLLLWLNRLIWMVFIEFSGYYDPLPRIVENLPNPRRTYLDACKEELKRLNWTWNNCEFLCTLKIEEATYSRKHGYYNFNEFTIENSIIKDKNNTAVSRLFGFLDQIAPALLLGIYELVFTDKNKFILIERW